MGAFFSLIENLSTGLYFICGVLLIWNLRSLMQARHELQLAQYGLEREMAERHGGRALTTVLLMAEFIIVVWGISSYASPTWSEGLPDSDTESNIDSPFITNTPAGDGSFDIQVRTLAPTDVLATAAAPSTPVGTIGPRSQRTGCDPNQAWIDYPANGMYVFEEVPVTGTANLENFAKYRFEIRKATDVDFSLYSKGDYNQPVVNGELGSFLPSVLLPGEYRFRLTVFDTNNNIRASCEITINIIEPVPTATLLGAVGAE